MKCVEKQDKRDEIEYVAQNTHGNISRPNGEFLERQKVPGDVEYGSTEGTDVRIALLQSIVGGCWLTG